MKRIAPYIIVGCLALGPATYGLYWLLDTCNPLDRLLGGTTCPERRITFAGFRPIDGQAISPIDTGGVANLYGWMAGSEAPEWSAALIRFDFDTGKQIDRQPIPYLNGNRWHMGFSDDGERAAITCFGIEPCSNDGWRHALVSVRDGAFVAALDTPVNYRDPLRFPGEPKPDVSLAEAARYAADGQRIVFVESGGDVSLQSADGHPIAMLFDDPRPRRGLTFLNALSVSPSGAYLALLDASRRAPALLVWETGTGTLLARFELPPYAYEIDIDPAWTQDEDRITIVRYRHDESPSLRETSLDIYAWR